MKNKLLTLVTLLALAVSIPAYVANASDAKPDEDTRQAPRLLEGNMPVYPDIARELGIEGIVRVEFLVDEKGNVFGAGVIQSVNPDLDQAAVAAVKDWKFKPATVEGNPVPQVVQVPIRFKLIEKDGKRHISVTSGVEIAARS